MLPLAALTALAFSSGGGEEGRQGSPTAQSCDAIYLCAFGGCPPGMTLVAPPERSTAYTLRTGDGPDPSNDPKTYVPGELMDLHVRVVTPRIQGFRNAGTPQCRCSGRCGGSSGSQSSLPTRCDRII